MQPVYIASLNVCYMHRKPAFLSIEVNPGAFLFGFDTAIISGTTQHQTLSLIKTIHGQKYLIDD